MKSSKPKKDCKPPKTKPDKIFRILKKVPAWCATPEARKKHGVSYHED
jgi:hypothetical protein